MEGWIKSHSIKGRNIDLLLMNPSGLWPFAFRCVSNPVSSSLDEKPSLSEARSLSSFVASHTVQSSFYFYSFLLDRVNFMCIITAKLDALRQCSGVDSMYFMTWLCPTLPNPPSADLFMTWSFPLLFFHSFLSVNVLFCGSTCFAVAYPLFHELSVFLSSYWNLASPCI